MTELLPNRLADQYVIHRTLAWGGEPVSYLEAERDGERLILCALPELFAAGPPHEAFVALGKRLMTLVAPSVLRVTACGVVNGIPLLEMDWDEGKPLSVSLAKAPLPSMPLLKVADQVLSALIQAHRASIVHGDITPENIIVTRQSDVKSPVVRLVGVGLGPLLRDFGAVERNCPMSGSYAFDYLPPEVARGQRASSRSDLYCVGVLMHHMVIGRPPEGYDSRDGFADIPQMPDVIRRATTRDPAERYADAAGMQAALDWLEIVSSKMSPHTQDIPLWMEHSVVSNIPPSPSHPMSTDVLPLRATPWPAQPPSAPPPGMLQGTHAPIRLPSVAPVRFVVSPSTAAPPLVNVPPAAPVPKILVPGEDRLWWVAAALCLAIILIVLAWLWLNP